MSGISSKAISEYNKATFLGITTWDIYTNLGLVYYNHGDLDRAIDNLELAVSLEPMHFESHYDLSIIYERTSGLRQAVDQIRRTALETGEPDAENLEAIIPVRMRSCTSGRDIWSRLVRESPKYALA